MVEYLSSRSTTNSNNNKHNNNKHNNNNFYNKKEYTLGKDIYKKSQSITMNAGE